MEQAKRGQGLFRQPVRFSEAGKNISMKPIALRQNSTHDYTHFVNTVYFYL